jgi:hypothetical protein
VRDYDLRCDPGNEFSPEPNCPECGGCGLVDSGVDGDDRMPILMCCDCWRERPKVDNPTPRRSGYYSDEVNDDTTGLGRSGYKPTGEGARG